MFIAKKQFVICMAQVGAQKAVGVLASNAVIKGVSDEEDNAQKSNITRIDF